MAADRQESLSNEDALKRKFLKLFSITSETTDCKLDVNREYELVATFKQELLCALTKISNFNITFNLAELKDDLCEIEELLDEAGEVLATLVNQQYSENLAALYVRITELTQIIKHMLQEDVSENDEKTLINRFIKSFKKIQSEFSNNREALEYLEAEMMLACINTSQKFAAIKAIKQAISQSEAEGDVQPLKTILSRYDHVDITQAYNTQIHQLYAGVLITSRNDGCSIIEFLATRIKARPKALYRDIFDTLLHYVTRHYAEQSRAEQAEHFVRMRMSQLSGDKSYELKLKRDKSSIDLAPQSPAQNLFRDQSDINIGSASSSLGSDSPVLSNTESTEGQNKTVEPSSTHTY